MKPLHLIYVLVLGMIAFGCNSSQNSPSTTEQYGLSTTVDAIVQPYLDSSQIAGVSIGIAKGDEIIFKKTYGYADLEFHVPTPEDASYEIGSITKQFTAVAILQLVEQGKLSLEDDMRTYLDTYDTQGRAITIERLLDHTSGIKSYTDVEFFGEIFMQKLPRDTMIAFLEKESFDFEPGEALIYNNSAFFLLGLIIEKTSGISYEEYVKQYLFEPAGMNDSYYCNERVVVQHRAHGYNPQSNGEFIRAGYLDHTWPYATGSLCSTVEDLIKWNKTLHRGRSLLSEKSYEQLITPGSLNDQTPLRYAKGLGIGVVGGHKIISHGGGIPGFLSDGRYYPEDSITIITLINTAGPVSPATISQKIARELIAFESPTPVDLEEDIDAYAGTFEGRGRGEDLTLEIEANDNQLNVKNGNEEPLSFFYAGNDRWERETEGSFNQYILFKKNGAIYDELRVDGGGSHYVLKRTK